MSDPTSLGEFLRRHREALAPAQAGHGRRRTPGLRREEVALAAGTSLTWYTWLEQGRDVGASPATLARLADALQLTRAERRYLFELAARKDPAMAVWGEDEASIGPLTALVQAVNTPAYVLDPLWSACAWNAAAEQLLRGWLDGADTNLLRFVFLDPAAPRLIRDWTERAQRLVGEFRAATATRHDDPRLRRFVNALQAASPHFARVWQDQRVLAREGGGRSFFSAQGTPCHYQQVTLTPSTHPAFTVVMLLPDATAM